MRNKILSLVTNSNPYASGRVLIKNQLENIDNTFLPCCNLSFFHKLYFSRFLRFILNMECHFQNILRKN